MIPILENKNINIQQEINGMEKSLAWQWYHFNEEEKNKNRDLFVSVLQKELEKNI